MTLDHSALWSMYASLEELRGKIGHVLKCAIQMSKVAWSNVIAKRCMQLMICLDLSRDSTIRRCDSGGCSNHFRAGPYSRARYCSSQCGSRASTRMTRGQEP